MVWKTRGTVLNLHRKIRPSQRLESLATTERAAHSSDSSKLSMRRCNTSFLSAEGNFESRSGESQLGSTYTSDQSEKHASFHRRQTRMQPNLSCRGSAAKRSISRSNSSGKSLILLCRTQVQMCQIQSNTTYWVSMPDVDRGQGIRYRWRWRTTRARARTVGGGCAKMAVYMSSLPSPCL